MFNLMPFNNRSNAADFFRSFLSNDLYSVPDATHSFNSDIRETATAYILECELPGVERKDISIEVEDGYLTVTAHSREENEQQERNYLRRERVIGTMRRTYHVANTKTEEITAKLADGILVVNIPKKDSPHHQNMKIDIQ